jgi:hypothetical protein
LISLIPHVAITDRFASLLRFVVWFFPSSPPKDTFRALVTQVTILHVREIYLARLLASLARSTLLFIPSSSLGIACKVCFCISLYPTARTYASNDWEVQEGKKSAGR